MSTKDASRSRVKTASALELVATSIAKLQELLLQAEDLKHEGFPYRDAVRARVELHVRECAKVVFADRSAESQQWKHYRMRTATAQEVTAAVAELHDFLGQLERRKLELLGVALPPAQAPASETATSKPSSPQSATASADAADPAASAAPAAKPEAPTPKAPVTAQAPVTPEAPARSTAPPQHPSTPEPAPAPVQAAPEGPQTAPTPQASAPQMSSSPPASQTSPGLAMPIAPEPREQVRDAAILAEAPAAAPRPLTPTRAESPEGQDAPNMNHPSPNSSMPSPAAPAPSVMDPLDTVRKICERFHRVTRHLRLRREYRPTLDVEDERDVQDLMSTLLRYELEEVSPYEWVPSYQQPTASVAMVLPRHHLVILAKKTRSGHGAKEIASELSVDLEEFPPAKGHETLACFVYDPDGRIGNPHSLEAELTKVSDAQVVEVIIYPK